MDVSLSAPVQPKSDHQSLSTTLRIKTLKPISTYSKASGVFSSRYRYPASSRESHFHRAHLWDSPPIITPFVRFGTSSVLSYLTISIRLYLFLYDWFDNFFFLSLSFSRSIHLICKINNFYKSIFLKMFLFTDNRTDFLE